MPDIVLGARDRTMNKIGEGPSFPEPHVLVEERMKKTNKNTIFQVEISTTKKNNRARNLSV